MIGARMFAIACGYGRSAGTCREEDCDDLDVLRFDPAFKLACGRLPESGRADVAADLVQARERPIMARTGAHGADDDRSVLRQLRARAPTHRARRLTIPLMPSTAASNWHCSTSRITTSTAFSPSTSSTRRPPSRCCRCCVRASGHPVTRRRGSCATSSAASGAIGPGSRSRCVATAITARPRSWTCWRIRATATFSGFPATPG